MSQKNDMIFVLRLETDSIELKMAKPKIVPLNTVVVTCYPCGLEKTYKTYRMRTVWERLHRKNCLICQKDESYKWNSDNDLKALHNIHTLPEANRAANDTKFASVRRVLKGGSSAIY